MEVIELARKFHVEACYKCGTPIFIDVEYLVSLKRDGRGFYCLRGHKQAYASREAESADQMRLQRDEARAEQQKLKERILELRSRLEQAEAHAADGKPMPAAPMPDAGKSEDSIGEFVSPKVIGRDIYCPHCEKTYRARGSFIIHLIAVHNVNAEIATRMATFEAIAPNPSENEA